jgi:glyoxylase-like metal-dependent hydrolase (beta-lactamase superfamily II)
VAADIAEVVFDPPERTFRDGVTVEFSGRQVELHHLGRGHTDNDIVVIDRAADVVCAGDLLENGATPYFGDGYPMDWPATVEALLALVGARTVIVPGHGDYARRSFAASSLESFKALAELAGRVHRGELDLAAAMGLAPYPAEAAAEPLARALAQLRGELDE